ncbi:hypothetical protein [Bradyrhizobium sp. STM 3562]
MRIAIAHLPIVKRFCSCVPALLFASAALGGIIALKTAIYFSRFGFGAL